MAEEVQTQAFPKKIAESPVKLVFYTDTDTNNEYPIYITNSREIWMKKRPSSEIVSAFNVKVVDVFGDVFPVSTEDKLAKVISDSGADEKTAELIKLAYTALRSLSSFAVFAKIFEIRYEVYRGDFREFLGENSVKAVRLSAYSKFSTTNEKQGWAIAFNSVKRIAAKYPQLAEFTYADVRYLYRVSDETLEVSNRRNAPHAIVRIKIPVVTQEFEKLFNIALATSAITTTTTMIDELEKQISQLEELIKQKEAELQALREQLGQLKMKLELERMKHQLV